MEKTRLATQAIRTRNNDADMTSRLVSSLRELFASGAIRPGEKLPPERKLAAEYGVNRTSLRMALSALEVMGVVVRRVGDGTYLAKDCGAILQAPMDFLVLVDEISAIDLLQARLMLEPELAARAAERATLAHLKELDEALRRMAEEGHEVDALAEADIAFHAGIARASGNQTFFRMFSVINRAMHQLLKVTKHSEPLKRKVRVHTAIYKAIHTRDADLARRLMQEHLQETLDFLMAGKQG